MLYPSLRRKPKCRDAVATELPRILIDFGYWIPAFAGIAHGPLGPRMNMKMADFHGNDGENALALEGH